jgi:hypothetical protein
MFRSCPPQAGHLELLHVFPPVLVCIYLRWCAFSVSRILSIRRLTSALVGRSEDGKKPGQYPNASNYSLKLALRTLHAAFHTSTVGKKQQRALRERELTAALWFSCCSLCKIAPVQGKYQSSNGMEADVEKC